MGGARRSLEAAEKGRISDRDRARLQYDLAIVGFYTGDKPEEVIRRLKASIDKADDPVQGYNVLTQEYLQPRQAGPRIGPGCELEIAEFAGSD